MTSVGRRMNCRVERGLTLIELMIVVAVLAILATVVVPTYERYLTSVRRADGRAAVTDVALAQERYISVYQAYTDDFTELRDRAGLDAALVKDADEGVSPKLHYTLAVTAATTNFTITATRVPTGADKDCLTMTLNSAGVKDGTGDDKSKCW